MAVTVIYAALRTKYLLDMAILGIFMENNMAVITNLL